MKWKTAALIAAPVAVALMAWGFYGGTAKGGKGNCPAASVALAQALRPLATGELAALKVDKAPKLATPVKFKRPDGTEASLADFRGRAVLLNLWATWCVPCRAEMPALDALQAQAGGPKFEVAAVNIDTARLERVAKFLDETGVKHLARYADNSGDAFETLRLAGKALGLPTTLMIDAEGCELGVVAGPANWAAPEAVKAVKALQGG